MTTNPYASLCRKYPQHIKIPGHHPIKPTPICESALLEQHTNTTLQTLQAIQDHCHMEHQGQVCLNAHNIDWLKELTKEIPEAKWEFQNIHNHPYQTALGSGQHSGLDKINKLTNDHPQASQGPDKTSALISTGQPHNCNIDEAPQNSSNQNLPRKEKDWRDWNYTDGSLQKNEVGQDTRSGVYHPHLNNSHYAILKGMGIINTIALTCRSSSCSHTRLLTYSHRQPYITAPNQKAALTPDSPSPPHPRRCPSIHC